MLCRHVCCVLSRLHCNGNSLLLGSYLSRIGRTENPSCSACRHSSQDISHLILHCPATDSLRRSLFGDSLSLYDLWSRPWSCLASGAPWSSAMPRSLGRGRVTNNKQIYSFMAYVLKGKISQACITTVEKYNNLPIALLKTGQKRLRRKIWWPAKRTQNVASDVKFCGHG